ncbi:rhomboid family intramembrane serine protease [Aurantimonas endophytica]|uniref:Membrane associated rhomboid family serine protease n=1 Tax=Aurantimonas endophytica TaxID=1522175 RepID=A0A7W6HA88_9HYPH|nr:rhomboid family intramembrane serine protease [Aurantimonas endophytica]MBB4001357.1 membrane associated rhomboid family serine protease [Aurantimonas endophytica]MCO6403000.1 rhomboid family intramembrane serine protease [Aurantimonas endophytica]
MTQNDLDEAAEPVFRRQRPPPAFNVPGIVLGLICVYIAVHAVRMFALSPLVDSFVLVDFAFIPGCYQAAAEFCAYQRPGAGLWSPLTYSFLHGDWMHLAVNSVWLLAFGTPVARRLGAVRFLVFSCCGAVAGAAAFYLLNPEIVAPVIGASGVVSALMGGACRFAFGGSGATMSPLMQPYLPVVSIRAALTNRTVLIFVAVFFGTNLLIGSAAGGFLGGGTVAWEAHLGGFAFGFLLFSFFDPRSRARV